MSKERLVELLREARCTDECGAFDNVKLCNGCFRYEKYNETADYLLANGVIVPPCKVGTKVYYFSENPLNLSVQANTIYEATVVRIVTTNLGTSLVIQIRNDYGCTEIPNINYFGKTVFLTREEAEAKLKERENNVKP